jgi:hypothetical protein
MTTFTSDDREEAYKKRVEEAPNQPGYEDAVPIPFAGWVKSSPPHIVDSGASVMKMSTNEPVAWTDGKGNYFDKNSFFPVNDLIPLYTHPVKELTDKEINKIFNTTWGSLKDYMEFARAILRKAQEK